MKTPDIKRSKELREEIQRLKAIFADLSLEHRTLKVIVKKAVAPSIQRELVDYARQEHGASLRMVCRVVNISDSAYRYKPDEQHDNAVVAESQDTVERYPSYGFSKLFIILHHWSHTWNRKWVYRLYFKLNISTCRRGKQRLPKLHLLRDFLLD